MNFNNIFKIILLGDSNVGKTSFLNKLIYNMTPNNYNPTIGVDLNVLKFEKNNDLIKLKIWDTAGQERFRSIITSYYKDSDGVFLLYDISNLQSFLNLKYWLKEIKEKCKPNIPILCIGNKNDLKRAVDYEILFEFIKKNNLLYCEISAKNESSISCNQNISILISSLTNEKTKNIDVLKNNECPQVKNCC